MSRRSRRGTSIAARRPARGQPTPQPPRRGWLPWAIGGVVALGAVGVIVALLLLPAPSSLNTGTPPWPPETTHLRARLQADGLPVLTTSGGVVLHIHQHLDVFIDGRPVQVPTNIGIDTVGGTLSALHTHDATGLIHVESPVQRTFTLGELFDVWGVQLTSTCIGGECIGNGRTLSVFVDGQAVSGDPRSIPLAAHDEIVLALGTAAQVPNPIPATYPFPGGL